MVKELDRHSRFHSPLENKEVKEDSAGKFAGIGVTMSYYIEKTTDREENYSRWSCIKIKT